MDAEHLRKLKHELRTPVNHILGYSELLLETASDAADGTMTSLAKNIHASGQTIARLMEKSLLSSSNGIDEAQISALRNSLRPVVEQILQVSIPDSTSLAESPYADELGRIHRAANQLMLLIG